MDIVIASGGESADASMQVKSAEDPTPTLAIFSSQWVFPEPQGAKTPPLRTSASVPFKWEEAPGRPKATPNLEIIPSTCLHLPPRLLVLADEDQGGSGRGFDSPSACTKLFGVPSHKRRPEFDFPALQKPLRSIWHSSEGLVPRYNNNNPELQSPRSILTGPNARSRGSSSSSQDSASALADTCALIASQDDVAAPQHSGLPPQIAREKSPGAADKAGRSAARNMRDIVGLWSKGLRRIKHGKKQPYAGSDAWSPTCQLQYADVASSPSSSLPGILGKKNDTGLGVRAAAKEGLTGTSLPRIYSPRCSPYTKSPARYRRGNVIKKRRRKWVFRKLKRSSTFFVAIWKRASIAVSSRRKKILKPRKSEQLNSYHTL